MRVPHCSRFCHGFVAGKNGRVKKIKEAFKERKLKYRSRFPGDSCFDHWVPIRNQMMKSFHLALVQEYSKKTESSAENKQSMQRKLTSMVGGFFTILVCLSIQKKKKKRSCSYAATARVRFGAPYRSKARVMRKGHP
jgi:hypothetical protein